MLKGVLGLLVVLGIVTVILSFVFAVPLLTALAVMLLVIFAPVAGILVGMFVPAPTIIKGILSLTVTVITIVFGLKYLGVV